MKKEIKTILETPFTGEQIKQRKGLWGKMLDYIEGHSVIQRLNDAFESEWSFEVTRFEILDEEVIVLGKLSVGDIVKFQFGSSNITRDSKTKNTLCIGDDLKSAATDALKKCASLFGIGLHLYGDIVITNPDTGNTVKPQTPSTPQAPTQSQVPQNTQKATEETLDMTITPKQMKYCFTLARRKGISDSQVEEMAVKLFGVRFHQISKLQASELINQLNA